MTRHRAAGIMLAACCLWFTGCASRGPLLEPAGRPIELTGTPFFPQDDLLCGPSTLATLLVASGVTTDPDAVTPLVYLPGRQGSLQIEMLAAPRGFDRIAYRIGNELESVAREIDAGRPVLVLHNYGLPSRPRWHYAVVIGYDPIRQQLQLRSGTTRRQVLSAARFMRAWDNAGRWAMVLLRPGELPAEPDRASFLEAATAFERAATPDSAARTYEAAIQRWPDDPVPLVGRGTAHYRAGAFQAAATDYHRALQIDPAQPVARNNLAMTLLDLGCPAAAARQLQHIASEALPDSLRAAIDDTRAQIAVRAHAPDAATCSSLHFTH